MSHEKIQGLIKCEGVTVAFMPCPKFFFLTLSVCLLKLGTAKQRA